MPQTKKLYVTNTGQRPVHMSFIPKLDEKAYCKPWLDVKPSSAVIRPRESASPHNVVGRDAIKQLLNVPNPISYRRVSKLILVYLLMSFICK